MCPSIQRERGFHRWGSLSHILCVDWAQQDAHRFLVVRKCDIVFFSTLQLLEFWSFIPKADFYLPLQAPGCSLTLVKGWCSSVVTDWQRSLVCHSILFFFYIIHELIFRKLYYSHTSATNQWLISFPLVTNLQSAKIILVLFKDTYFHDVVELDYVTIYNLLVMFLYWENNLF